MKNIFIFLQKMAKTTRPTDPVRVLEQRPGLVQKRRALALLFCVKVTILCQRGAENGGKRVAVPALK